MAADFSRLNWTPKGVEGNLTILRAELANLEEQENAVRALIHATQELCPHGKTVSHPDNSTECKICGKWW